MSPAEAAIREALAAGPTEGPWHAPGLGEVMDQTSRVIMDCIDVDPVDEELRPVPGHDEGERNAKYLAACNPAAIRSLLSELDHLTRELEEWRKLKDPEVLHANLLRGIPATLSRDKLLHLVGDVGLEEARKDAQLWQFWKPWIERRVGDLSLYDANQAQEK